MIGTRLAVAILCTAFVANVLAIELSGICGQCAFMNSTDGGSSGCIDFVSSGGTWDESASGRRFYMRMWGYRLCLGYPYEDNKKLFVTRLMPAYSRYPRVRIMNMFAMLSDMWIVYNEASGFATVHYPHASEAGTDYVIWAGNLLGSPWLNVTGEPRSSNVLVLRPRVPVDSDIEDNRHMYYCYKGEPAGCVPDVWSQEIVDGNSPADAPGSRPNPVVQKRVWCTKVGQQPVGSPFCGSHRCNENVIDCTYVEDLPPDRQFYCKSPRKNACMNSGVCYCNPHFGGPTCEFEFPQPMDRLHPNGSEWIENLKCKPDFAAGKPNDYFHPHCFWYNINYTLLPNSWRLPEERSAEEYRPYWPRWDFWTCDKFDPCNGTGICIDSHDRYEPPRCLCFPGFFGTHYLETEAYARAFSCSSGTGAENLQYWREDQQDIRRYMLTHQCVLWNGPDSPRQYVLASQSYRPAVPTKCQERTYKETRTGRGELVDYDSYFGLSCLPCPPCARSNGTCATANWTNPDGNLFNVCLCDDAHIGAACTMAKCPMFKGSMCGQNLPVPRGRCVLKDPQNPYEQFTNVTESPFHCECDNGYTGNACQQRLCAFTGPHINDSQVCSGSALSMFTSIDGLPAHGFCNQTSHNTSACVCLPGYTGLACQLKECPRVNGTGPICNDVQPNPALNKPVCVNANPNLEPVCDCTVGFLPRHASKPGQEYKRFWGRACEHTYNETCADPNDKSGYYRWCNEPFEDYKVCKPMEPRPPSMSALVWLNTRPVCQCLPESDRIGTYCELSKCGQRNDKDENPVPPDQICNGYAKDPDIKSGVCKPLSMPMQGTLPPMDFIPGVLDGSLAQTLGHCRCNALRVKSERNPRILDFTTFQGSWCQTKVHGCTNPDDEALADKETILPCTSRPGMIRGICMEVPHPLPAEQMRPKPRPENSTFMDSYRCVCAEGFGGSYCQDIVNKCERPCKPGAGECVKSETGAAPHCECFAPTLWTSKENPLMPKELQPACSMDWCNSTGGITSIYGGQCFCPVGRAYTKVEWPLQDETKHPPLGYFAGCRFTCPFQNGIECGGTRLIPEPGTAQHFCSNAMQVNNIDMFLNPKPECKCYSRDGILHGVMGIDPVFHAKYQAGQLVSQNPMLYTFNEATKLCEPFCGNGAKMEYPIVRGEPKCTCVQNPQDQNDKPRWAFCKDYLGPQYKVHRCGGVVQGTWDDSKNQCKCFGLWSPPTCTTSNCAPKGSYTPRFGPNICNCTHPYKTDLDIFSRDFGSCISNCGPNGKADLATRSCVCHPAYRGRYCETNQCLPYGSPRTKPEPGKTIDAMPCYCVTPVYAGKLCNQDACREGRGKIETPENAAPYCKCFQFFGGTLCEKDLCGIVGDDQQITGYAELKEGSTQDYRCRCLDGYETDASGICTRRLCGPRGLVIQNKPLGTGFTCKCQGPDIPDPKSSVGACIERSCGHGTTLNGFNNTRVTCLCDQGFTGVNCTTSVCPIAGGRIAFVQGQCRCLYPWQNEVAECNTNICGPGAKGVLQVNVPGNPIQWECQCDGERGFVLQPVAPKVVKGLLGADAVPDAANVRCVLQCVMNHTAQVTSTKCVCKSGYFGIWCQTALSDCPHNGGGGQTLEENGVSKQTFVISVSVLSIVAVSLLVGVIVLAIRVGGTATATGTGATTQAGTVQEKASTAERASLLGNGSTKRLRLVNTPAPI